MAKAKIQVDDKIEAVKEYLEGGGSMRTLAKKYGVHHSSIEKWVLLYRTFGWQGMRETVRYRDYSEELKQQAVELYRSTDKSLRDVCEQLELRSLSLLQSWLVQYGHNTEEEEQAGESST